jgi:ribosomal protein S18 acetylase RimI-like enzyme
LIALWCLAAVDLSGKRRGNQPTQELHLEVDDDLAVDVPAGLELFLYLCTFNPPPRIWETHFTLFSGILKMITSPSTIEAVLGRRRDAGEPRSNLMWACWENRLMEIRPMRSSDREPVAALDTTVRCSARARLRFDGAAVVWRSEPIPPFEKTYEHAELGPLQDNLVALDDEGGLLGVASIAFRDWNRRMALQAIYVDRGSRGQGVGRGLMEICLKCAVERRARHLWLETQDTNCGAITFYERLGFSIVGFDRSLYRDGPHAEMAVLMARPTPPPSPV